MGYWDEDPSYPLADWRYEVKHDETRLGYWKWVELQKEMFAYDNEEKKESLVI